MHERRGASDQNQSSSRKDRARQGGTEDQTLVIANACVAARAGIANARVPPCGTKELSPALQRWEGGL